MMGNNTVFEVGIENTKIDHFILIVPVLVCGSENQIYL
jgi:hypothetical protein